MASVGRRADSEGSPEGRARSAGADSEERASADLWTRFYEPVPSQLAPSRLARLQGVVGDIAETYSENLRAFEQREAYILDHLRARAAQQHDGAAVFRRKTRAARWRLRWEQCRFWGGLALLALLFCAVWFPWLRAALWALATGPIRFVRLMRARGKRPLSHQMCQRLLSWVKANPQHPDAHLDHVIDLCRGLLG